MFSKAQKQEIAAKLEAILLSYGHPEMPTEKPRFQLHVKGKEDWSWAVIEPNWQYLENTNKAPLNPHNEMQAIKCNPPAPSPESIAALGGIKQLWCPRCLAYHYPTEPC
jgi:hypothetical protein